MADPRLLFLGLHGVELVDFNEPAALLVVLSRCSQDYHPS